MGWVLRCCEGAIFVVVLFFFFFPEEANWMAKSERGKKNLRCLRWTEEN